MSKEKHPSIFSPQMVAIVSKLKLGNILGNSPVLVGEYSVM